MVSANERIAKELKSLLEQAGELSAEIVKKKGGDFKRKYQSWYSRAMVVVKQLLPERLGEFTSLYDGESSYDIVYYMRGDYSLSDTDRYRKGAGRHFVQQYFILESAQTRLDDILTNIYGLVQAEILDSELDAATELWRAGHIRSAGTLAGVVLERHLAKVCLSRTLTSRKKKPTLSDWNDILKDANVYDIPTWRGIQRYSDIRNLCAHPGDREPTKEEVDELIRGVERVTKTIL